MQLGNKVIDGYHLNFSKSQFSRYNGPQSAIMAHNPHTILILVILVWEVLWATKCHNKSIMGIRFYPCNLHFGHFGLGGIKCAPPSAIIIYKTHTNKLTFIYEEKLLFLNNSKNSHAGSLNNPNPKEAKLVAIGFNCGHMRE